MAEENKTGMGIHDVSRRDFLVGCAAAGGALAAGSALAETAGNGNIKEKVVHLVGYSHIDAAWLWPWTDGADSALDTFRSALNRMEETPGFCYSHSSSAHYQWVERADPAMFAQVRQRIREGRWEVVGGWPVEPDCNIPSTESLVRHCLYGKEYCRRSLGVDVKIAMNPDSFGHGAGLPTILQSAGYGYYAFMRPQEHEMRLPHLFWWEGPDGSRVLTWRIWKDYDPGKNIESMIRASAGELFTPGVNHAAIFVGVGDHGGAVTRQQIRTVLELQKEPNLPELRWSPLADFFSAVEKSPGFASLPIVKGELQHHARGCYSAYGEGKYLNRRAERVLGEAEAVSVAAALAIGHPYPQREFAESWWKVAFNQFHDLMAGTALYTDYAAWRDGEGYACETAMTSKVTALEAMAVQVDTSAVKENALFLFNPLPWPRKALAEVIVSSEWKEAGPMYLAAKDGEKIAAQWRPSPSMTNFFPRLSAMVELPACGYKVFELMHGEAPAQEKFTAFFKLPENGFGIASLKAADGTELLAGPVGLVVVRDTSDTWAHDIAQFRDEIGRPTFAASSIVEDGALTRITRHRAGWRDSEIILNIRQIAGLDVVELHFIIDWHQREQMLMLEIPTALTQAKIFAKVPGAILERSTNGEEEPYQDWAAIQGNIGGAPYTVAAINNSTYSYDCLNGLFRTVLIRSAPFARHNPNQVPRDDDNAWQDQGRQERTFWLLGGKGPYTQFALDRRADEMQTPAEHVMDSAHPGRMPWQHSFLEVAPENVQVVAVKRAEEAADGTVIRIQERAGAATTAIIRSAAMALEHQVALRPWELKTVIVKYSAGGKAEVRESTSLET
jgi:alpha-mannosidase